MILESKKTTVAYRCPECGAGVLSMVDIFSLSANRVKLKCDCGKSDLDVVIQSDGKIRLTVPCIFCRKPHVFTVNKQIFYGRDLFVLPCPYSDINICFMGDSNHVKAELARSELELLDMLEQNGIESFSAFDGDDEVLPAGWYDLAEGFSVGFKTECDLLPDDFPKPCFQMEFEHVMPWVLNEPNPYIYE